MLAAQLMSAILDANNVPTCATFCDRSLSLRASISVNSDPNRTTWLAEGKCIHLLVMRFTIDGHHKNAVKYMHVGIGRAMHRVAITLLLIQCLGIESMFIELLFVSAHPCGLACAYMCSTTCFCIFRASLRITLDTTLLRRLGNSEVISVPEQTET